MSVSILARPEGRALRSQRISLASCAVFQSSPAPRDGRYRRIQRYKKHSHWVSILARPEGRALPPTNPANEAINLFQSSPAPRDGRYRIQPNIPAPILSFNPRPPRGTGATKSHIWSGANSGVSILARPEGRALLGWGWWFINAHFVSILARPEGRALPPRLRE